jgi:hypothetical protein
MMGSSETLRPDERIPFFVFRAVALAIPLYLWSCVRFCLWTWTAARFPIFGSEIAQYSLIGILMLTWLAYLIVLVRENGFLGGKRQRRQAAGEPNPANDFWEKAQCNKYFVKGLWMVLVFEALHWIATAFATPLVAGQ